ncbi:uncharacterized protein [Prorops nasuta]|uniref:uncharacterized protein n=1 Tax=Prorops nasuta TaxID=863751 RepID=UPI0034CD7E35
MVHLLYAYVFAAFCVVGSLQWTPFERCNEESIPTDLRIVGCHEFHCFFKESTNITGYVDFKVVSDTRTLTPRVQAILFNTPSEYSFAQKDACNSLVKGECPLKKDGTATYNFVLPVLYEPIFFLIEFALIDEHQNAQVCFRFRVKTLR